MFKTTILDLFTSFVNGNIVGIVVNDDINILSKAKNNKKLTKSKKSDFVIAKNIKKLAKFKKPDFVKANFFRTDFLIFKT